MSGDNPKMKQWTRWSIYAIAIAALLISIVGPARAMSPVPMPQTPLVPPTPEPSLEAMTASEPTGLRLQALSGLKAVLVVGPIDGDTGDWTTSEKNNMEKAAVELEANGVTVYRFYTPNNDWNQIKAAAQGAHFFLYRGHGVYWPPPDMPSPPVGGFALKNRIISPDEIRRDLRPAPGAIFMLYACFAAGTSSLDTTGISSAEAQRRVAQYSDPFLDIGAAGYYANWYGSAFQMFIRFLFEGKTLGEAYESYFDFNADTVERYVHPEHTDKAMWIDKNYWSEQWKYSNAFVGQPTATLTSLFDPRAMVVNPPEIACLARPGDPPKAFDLVVGCTTPDTFTWRAFIEPAEATWVALRPSLQGMAGQSANTVIDPGGLPNGVYEATIRIVADDPNLQNGEQTVRVRLTVSDQLHQVFLPIVLR